MDNRMNHPMVMAAVMPVVSYDHYVAHSMHVLTESGGSESGRDNDE